MNLTIPLSPETEAKLREQAALTGKGLEELAVQALEEQLAIGPAPTAPRSPEQWVEDFRVERSSEWKLDWVRANSTCSSSLRAGRRMRYIDNSPYDVPVSLAQS
jgi:hypothetical protein